VIEAEIRSSIAEDFEAEMPAARKGDTGGLAAVLRRMEKAGVSLTQAQAQQIRSLPRRHGRAGRPRKDELPLTVTEAEHLLSLVRKKHKRPGRPRGARRKAKTPVQMLEDMLVRAVCEGRWGTRGDNPPYAVGRKVTERLSILNRRVVPLIRRIRRKRFVPGEQFSIEDDIEIGLGYMKALAAKGYLIAGAEEMLDARSEINRDRIYRRILREKQKTSR
jgi:MoxR-like ATPase